MQFDQVWLNIINNENKFFKTVTGKSFSYTISENILQPVVDGVEIRNISKSNIERAFHELPVSCPSAFSTSIQGTSYLFAILTDIRITG